MTQSANYTDHVRLCFFGALQLVFDAWLCDVRRWPSLAAAFLSLCLCFALFIYFLLAMFFSLLTSDFHALLFYAVSASAWDVPILAGLFCLLKHQSLRVSWRLCCGISEEGRDEGMTGVYCFMGAICDNIAKLVQKRFSIDSGWGHQFWCEFTDHGGRWRYWFIEVSSYLKEESKNVGY